MQARGIVDASTSEGGGLYSTTWLNGCDPVFEEGSGSDKGDAKSSGVATARCWGTPSRLG